MTPESKSLIVARLKSDIAKINRNLDRLRKVSRTAKDEFSLDRLQSNMYSLIEARQELEIALKEFKEEVK